VKAYDCGSSSTTLFSLAISGFWEKRSTILKTVLIRNWNRMYVDVYVVTTMTTYATIMIGIRARS
jgi:hypothetical protein